MIQSSNFLRWIWKCFCCCWLISNLSYVTVSISTIICIFFIHGWWEVASLISHLWDVGARGENWWDAALRIAHILDRSAGSSAAAFGTEPSAPFKEGGAWLVCDYWPTDVKVSVTCLVKRKKFEGMGERGRLCNQLHQWLITISMREISRHTEGLSKPPTLSIYLSFSSSSFQPLVFCLFAAPKIRFLSPVGRHDAFYISPPSVLSVPFPSFFSFSTFPPPVLNEVLCFYGLTHTITG